MLDPAAAALLRTDAYIDGRWIAGEPRFFVDDPSTGEVIARVPELPDAEVDRAIDAAARAFPAWRDRSAYERAACLAGIAARMKQHEGALAQLMTAENGKPLSESVAEVRYAASFLDWFAGEAVRVYGETVPATRADQRIVVTRAPIGPCALITPWNFPAAMLTRKLGPALAVGCTVVAKPAELTPLTTLALAQLAEDAGVPAGVLNIVTGEGKRVGARIAADPRIRKVSFTGSTAVGRGLGEQCGRDLKRVSLELGGNAPFVVFADCDLDAMVAGAMIAKFRNTGQSCVAANRFLVEQRAYDDVVRRLARASSELVVADGRAPGAQIGPLIDGRAVAKVAQLVDDAVARGARLVLGSSPRDSKSRFVAPIVLADVTREMAIWKSEIFGPVVALAPFDGEADAVAKANDTDAGLIAYLWTKDAARQVRVTAALEAGMVGVNEGLVSTAQAPFGGIKTSGMGREGSRHGIDDYTDLKYVMQRIG